MKNGTIRTLVLTEGAIAPLLFAEGLQADWFSTFAVRGELLSRSNKFTSIISKKDEVTSPRLAVIRLFGMGGVFSNLSDSALRLDAFRRTLRVLMSRVDQSISVPREWKSYFHQQLKYYSFQAARRGSEYHGRIHIADTTEAAQRCLFVYYCGDKDQDLERPDHFRPDLVAALGAIRTAVAVPDDVNNDPIKRGEFVLEVEEQEVGEGFAQGLSAAEWVELKLTQRQRSFVEYDAERSARIVGPAGTGKTLAMVVKCLVQSQFSETSNIRIGFLSHSNATARLVRDMLLAMDRDLSVSPDESTTLVRSSGAEIQVTTLFGLANGALKFDLQGLNPISEDAFEGRELQIEVIRSVLADFRAGDWALYRDRCSKPLREYIDMEVGSTHAKFFEYELMNEFACVIDAEGASTTVAHKERYLQRDRKAWMMPLESGVDREIVWNLYVRFRRFLAEMSAIGVDQLIADYVRHLDSFAWNARRERVGFDRILVDELHLFNRQEKDAITLLGRKVEKEPVLVVAYDNKQSPRDTFVGVPAGQADQLNLWRHESVTSAKKFEVSEIFRYTPEIAAFLEMLDREFPLLDLGGDWTAFGGVSNQKSGMRPTITVVASAMEQYKSAFERAAECVRRLKSGKKVAVLCCNAERFQMYCEAGEYRERIFPIRSREEAARLQYAGKRFIVSMPEYVAGLQFESVNLLDVNDDEVLDAPGNAGAKRRFLSTLYLGASRAEKRLELYAVGEGGGVSRFLRRCLEGEEAPLQRTPDCGK